MVDIVTRTKTSPLLAGRTGNSLRTKGVFGASYTAALAVRIVPSAPCFPTVSERTIRLRSARSRKYRSCVVVALSPAYDSAHSAAATVRMEPSARRGRHVNAIGAPPAD